MSIGKWLGVGAGWFFGGPIGAIIGYHIGKNFFNGKNDNEKAYEVSLLILASLVIKADGKVVKSELEYVRAFFLRTFGDQKSKKYFSIFNKINKQDLITQIRPICLQLTQSVNHASRLQIIHFLFGVASSDSEVHSLEINLIRKISSYLNINSSDFESIEAMFSNEISGIEKYYKLLEIDKTATNEQVKKAHRKMIMKFHPDRLKGVSDDIVKLANEKFLLVQEAYEKIMLNRK